MPSRPAARHTSDRSPDGSAAASCSSRRVWSGRASSWRAKLSSIRPVSGAAPGRPNPPASSAGVSPRGSSSSASGLPAGLGDDQVADPRVQRPGQRRVQQRPRVIVPQPVDFQLGQPGQLRARLAGREHQPDRVGRQPPRREPQRLRRGPVQPLLVVDQADQRAFPGHLRTAGSARPARPGTGPAAAPRRGRTRSAARPAAAPAGAPRGPASARTADAAPRTPAPSPTARPPRAPPGTPNPTPARPGSPAARSCPRPGRRAPPGPGSHRPGPPRPAGRARRARCAGPSAPSPGPAAGRDSRSSADASTASRSPGWAWASTRPPGWSGSPPR